MSKRARGDSPSARLPLPAPGVPGPTADVFGLRELATHIFEDVDPLTPLTLDDMAAILEAFPTGREAYPAGLLVEAERLLRESPNLPPFVRAMIREAVPPPSPSPSPPSLRITRNKDGGLVTIDGLSLRIFYHMLIHWLDAYEWIEEQLADITQANMLTDWVRASPYERSPPLVHYWITLFRGAAAHPGLINLALPDEQQSLVVMLGYCLPTDASSMGGFQPYNGMARPSAFCVTRDFASVLAVIYGYPRALESLVPSARDRSATLIVASRYRSLFATDAEVNAMLTIRANSPIACLAWLVERARVETPTRLRQMTWRVYLAVDHVVDPVEAQDIYAWANKDKPGRHLSPESLAVLMTPTPLRSRTRSGFVERFVFHMWVRGVLSRLPHNGKRQRFKLARIFFPPNINFIDFLRSYISVITGGPNGLDTPLRWLMRILDRIPAEGRTFVIRTLGGNGVIPYTSGVSARTWLTMAHTFANYEFDPATESDECPPVVTTCILFAFRAVLDQTEFNGADLSPLVHNPLTPHCPLVVWDGVVKNGSIAFHAMELGGSIFLAGNKEEVISQIIEAMRVVDMTWDAARQGPSKQSLDPRTRWISPLQLALLSALLNVPVYKTEHVVFAEILPAYSSLEELVNNLVTSPFVTHPVVFAGIAFTPLGVVRALIQLYLHTLTHRGTMVSRGFLRTSIAQVLRATSLPEEFLPILPELTPDDHAGDSWEVHQGYMCVQTNGTDYPLLLPLDTTLGEAVALCDSVYGTSIGGRPLATTRIQRRMAIVLLQPVGGGITMSSDQRTIWNLQNGDVLII